MWEYFLIRLVDAFYSLTRLAGDWFNEHGVNVLLIVLSAWIIRRFGAKLISQVLRRTIRVDLYPTKADREKRLRTLNSLVGAFTRVGIYIFAAILLVGEINPAYTTALFTSAGFIGIALGFGAQSLIKDFVSGVFIIVENQYRVGDIVELNDVGGTVEDITIRTTVLRDLDGNLHHVPNGTIQVTTNKTIGFSRINEDIVVAHDTDVDRLEQIINRVGQDLAAMPEYKHKIQQAPHLASIKGLVPAGIVVKILGKTSASEQWKVRSQLLRMLTKAFNEHGIIVSPVPMPPPPPKKKK